MDPYIILFFSSRRHSSYRITKPVGTDNDKAIELKGDDLEVLALAAIALASLQRLENEIFSSAILFAIILGQRLSLHVRYAW